MIFNKIEKKLVSDRSCVKHETINFDAKTFLVQQNWRFKLATVNTDWV